MKLKLPASLACGCLPALLLAAFAGAPAPGVAGDAKASSPYLERVKASADALLANAVDRYGGARSSQIISILDPKDGKPLEAPLPKPPGGVRNADRTGPYGSNMNIQMELYRTLQELSRLTGDPRYAETAKSSLKDFLATAQSKETGLFAWGEHLYWDCLEEKPGDFFDKNAIHEPKRKLIYFDLFYELDPARTMAYAKGLWDNQIADHETGDFSRHARCLFSKPGRGYDFPKEGGYFIDVWSRAFEKSKDPVFQTATRVLAKRYLARTNERGLLDFDSSGKPERVNNYVSLWSVSLALEAHDAAKRMDPESALVLRDLEERMDKGFLSLAHEPADPEKGFIAYAYTDSGLPRPNERKQTDGHSHPWGMGYGVNTSGMFATLCYSRQAQLGDSPKGEVYRKLVLDAGKLYATCKPDPQKDIWACEYALGIFSELAAYRLSGDKRFLAGAKDIGDASIKALWDDGKLALPKASVKCSYYDCISYPDSLLLALLALHEALNGLPPAVPISDTIR